MAEAAIAAGADALYLAGPSFGARAYAQNFSAQALSDLLRKAHLQGIRIYVTVNTLIKEKEMDQALHFCADLYRMGVDALIVQDPGLIRHLNRALPDLPLHGSTQMSITSQAGAEEAERLGLSRIVLGREMSQEEATLVLGMDPLEGEVFIHGSLCVCQSGQCLLSSFQGGRSGNRGRCAQPCRKSYWLENQAGKVLADREDFLSLRDLCTLQEAPLFSQLGVRAVKIEGRMKKPAYVYQAVKAYQAALAGQNPDPAPLQLMTNRPFTKGFFFHDFGRAMANPKRDRSGLYLGQIERIQGFPALRLTSRLEQGDQISVEGARSRFPITLTEDQEQGSILFFRSYSDVKIGSLVYWIDRSANRKELAQALEKREGLQKLPLQVFLRLEVGQALFARLQAEGLSISLTGPVVDQARTRALTEEDLKRSFEKLGETPFYLDSFDVQLEGAGFLPMGAVHAFRRAGVLQVMDQLSRPRRLVRDAERTLESVRLADRGAVIKAPVKSQATACFLQTAYAPDHYPKPQRQRLAGVLVEESDQVRSWKKEQQNVYLVLPQLMEKSAFLSYVQEHWSAVQAADGYVLSTINELGYLSHLPKDKGVLLGPGMQVMNRSAALAWLDRVGDRALLGIFPSPELTIDELAPLLALPLPWILPVYGRFSGMVMRHCPMAVLKACQDETGCKCCPYRSGHFLVDEFGPRECIRRWGSSLLLTAEVLDARDLSAQLRALPVAGFLLMDRGEGEFCHVLDQWQREACKPDRRPVYLAKQEMKRSLGHYQSPIE